MIRIVLFFVVHCSKITQNVMGFLCTMQPAAGRHVASVSFVKKCKQLSNDKAISKGRGTSASIRESSHVFIGAPPFYKSCLEIQN